MVNAWVPGGAFASRTRQLVWKGAFSAVDNAACWQRGWIGVTNTIVLFVEAADTSNVISNRGSEPLSHRSHSLVMGDAWRGRRLKSSNSRLLASWLSRRLLTGRSP